MAELTPMMKQYMQLKAENKDSILFFRLGDFYEMFHEDATLVSQELDIALTTRDRNKPPEERTPMCGVPYHASEGYIARLIQKGYKVAICEQTEDPASAKGIVKRDIVRVITPGTLMESSMLDERANHYLCTIYLAQQQGAVAFCDLSTGECQVTEFAPTEEGISHLRGELARFSPREAIFSPDVAQIEGIEEYLTARLSCAISQAQPQWFSLEEGQCAVKAQFTEYSDGFSWEHDAVICAVGALLQYLNVTQKTQLSHIARLSYYTAGKFMELDLTARQTLELTQTMRTGERKGSLLWVLDKTKTAMGGRLLRNWIERPLLSPVAIGKRQQAVLEFLRNLPLRDECREVLRDIPDLERLIGRAVYGTISGRDLLALATGLKKIMPLKALLANCNSSQLATLYDELDPLPQVSDEIIRAMTDEPPLSVREGGMIRAGYDKEIDRLNYAIENGGQMLADLEARMKEETGIRNLKVRYNRVFGYYIEVAKSQVDLAPPQWARKQTTVNAERFINEELKQLEHTILSARETVAALEYAVFVRLRTLACEQMAQIQKSAQAVACVDVLSNFAHIAQKQDYCMPQVDQSDVLHITQGRHPVVETMRKDTLFVPNDTTMNGSDHLCALITGPNMAGKSTYMRQVALIVIMAQMGCFIPAQAARIGCVDRIFTRIGASDDLSAGQSTFMVEMSEVSSLLKNATRSSLLILDEIGRGTSTYDGMAIARAVLEQCVDRKYLGAKTLFATHYHELTVLEDELVGVKNYNIAAKKTGSELTFLRKIMRGGADQSYGIEVAKLAGVPARVINRARVILTQLEQGTQDAPAPRVPQAQVSMQDIGAKHAIEKLKQTNVNELSPIQALNLLAELKQDVGEE